MNDDLETLLRKNLLQPPPDFAQRVMTNLAVKNLAAQIATASLPGWTEARPEACIEARPEARPTASGLAPVEHGGPQRAGPGVRAGAGAG